MDVLHVHIYRGLAIKEMAPIGKTQKRARGCPQGPGELLGHGDGAAEPHGPGHPRG